jgi:hypothetical protein
MISYGKQKLTRNLQKEQNQIFPFLPFFLPIHKSIHTEIRVLDGKGNYYLLFKRFSVYIRFQELKKNQG